MDPYDKEHASWVHLCERLLELGIDPNDVGSDYLIGAIRQWGNAFANLPTQPLTLPLKRVQ